MSKFDCALCGRDITDDGASFSSYLDGVKESRCPECGGAQGVDVEGLRAENAALLAENDALREACTLALGIMEQKNRVKVLPTAKFVDVKFDPEDIAVLRAALEKKP